MTVEQELPEFDLNMLIGAIDEELDVFDHLEHCASSIQCLRSNSRAITIVNTIVASLKDLFETIIHAFPCGCSGCCSIAYRQCDIGRLSDAEHATLCVRVSDP